MAKRFTDTEKWRKKWFRALPSKYKALWSYMCDTCDPAGVWEVDLESAAFHIGEEFSEEETKAIMDKQILEFKPGKWWLVDFVLFQYGTLSESCKPHFAVIELLKKHTLYIPFVNGIQRDKDKDKEKDKDNSSLLNKNVLPFADIISDLNEKTGKNFKATTKDVQELIRARIHEGFTVEDFFKVHENMTAKWKGDPKMDRFLRPSTLYAASKFQGYLNETPSLSDTGKISSLSQKNLKVFENFKGGDNA